MTFDSAPDHELPELTAAEEERLATALRHAFSPSEIDPARHEQLLSEALLDPFAPASPEELVESERLRRALDGHGDLDHQDFILARALAAAHAPQAVPSSTLETAAGKAQPPQPPRGARVLLVRFGSVVAALAAAAAVLFSFGSQPSRSPAPDLQALTLAQSRSTAPLFRAVATVGAPSTRIDRIASVRERELRENRYALWGVR